MVALEEGGTNRMMLFGVPNSGYQPFCAVCYLSPLLQNSPSQSFTLMSHDGDYIAGKRNEVGPYALVSDYAIR